MYEYKTELVTMPYHFFRSTATETDLTKVDEIINKYAGFGWELVTYAYMGGNNEVEKGILITFRKERE